MRAPVSGFILEKVVEIGDPVVPLTSSFQEGTVLMTMADMGDLSRIFRGTVDEIDVGRLSEGMAASIQVGALPKATVNGRLEKIWLKAQQEEGSHVHRLPRRIGDHRGALASGSAEEEGLVDSSAEVPQRARHPKGRLLGQAGAALLDAEIVIERRSTASSSSPTSASSRAGQALADDGEATVQLALAEGASEARARRWSRSAIGLSDAIHIEVLSGLEEGARRPREAAEGDRVGLGG